MTAPIPDARRLAALLDGRLSAAEREQLLGELAASDDALDVYADAAAALAELEHEGVDARPVTAAIVTAAVPAAVEVPRPIVVPIDEARSRRGASGGRWGPGWAAAAAAVAVVALAPALWWRTHTEAGGPSTVPPMSGPVQAIDGPLSYVTLLAPAVRAAGLPAGWDGTPWRVMRGAGDSATAQARAVRLGARVTDLELAAAAGDTAAVRTLAATVATLLDAVPTGGAAAVAYRALDPGSHPAALARAWQEAALTAGEADATLGAWLEAARVAAARRDAAFFHATATHTAVERLRRADTGRADVTEDAAAASARVVALVSREPLAWGPMEEALGALLQALGR